MKLFSRLKKLSLKKKIIFLGAFFLILAILSGGFWYLKKHPPWAAEVIGTPQVAKMLWAASDYDMKIFKTDSPPRIYTTFDNGIKIFDNSDPMHPRELSNGYQFLSPGGGNWMPVDFLVSGNYLYAAAGTRVFILDISDPAAITEVAQFPTVDSVVYHASALDLLNNTLYVTESSNKVWVFDVSNPAAHPLIKKITFSTTVYAGDTNPIKAREIGGKVYLFIGSHFDFKIIDDAGGLTFTTPIFSFVSAGRTPEDFEIQGNYAYLAAAGGGLQIVDLTGIGTWTSGYSPPVVDKVFSQSFPDFRGLSILGNYVYVANGPIGYGTGGYIFDISNPADAVWVPGPAPSEPTTHPPPRNLVTFGVPMDTAIDPRGYLYLTDNKTMFNVYNIQDLASNYYPPIIQVAPVLNGAFDVAFLDNKGMVVVTALGLQFWDATDPRNPVFKSRYFGDDPQMFRGLSWGNGVVASKQNYVIYSQTGADGQFKVFDASDISSPQQIASIELDSSVTGTSWFPDDIFVAENNAYVITMSRLYIVDITNPSNPIFKSYVDLGGTLYRVAVKDNFAFIVQHGGGIKVVNTSDPENPIIESVNFLDSSSNPIVSLSYPDVSISGNRLVISSFTPGKNYLFNIANPLAPTLYYQFQSMYTLDQEIVGDLLYTLGTNITIYDIEDPAQPRFLVSGGSTPWSGLPETRMKVKDDLAFTTGYYTGGPTTPANHVRIVELPPLAVDQLAINKTVSDTDETDVLQTTSLPGETLTYKLLYVNSGNTTLTNPNITDTLSNLTSYVSGGNFDSQSNVISFNLGSSLTPGQTGQVVFTVRIDSNLLVGNYWITNFGTISVTELAPIDSNIVRTLVTVGENKLEINKTVSDSDERDVLETKSIPGEVLTYKLNYKNTGTTTLTQGIITDKIPDKTTFYSGGTFDGGDNLVSFDVGDLMVGQSGQVEFKVKINSDLPVGTHEIINFGTIKVAEMDPINSNQVKSIVAVTTNPSEKPPTNQNIVPPAITTLVKAGAAIGALVVISLVSAYAITNFKRRKKSMDLKNVSREG